MSASYIGAMFSSNLALGYMSYPAQALAKSCKLIPVMLSRFVLMRGDVRYSRREVLQVIAITAGIGVFMMGAEGSGHGKKERETSWLGLGLCILSLALDGYTGPAQERLNKTYPQLSMATMMFYLNAWAILLVAVALMFTGQMMPGLQFCMDNPSILSEAALFSLCASSGQALILYTLLQFNSLVVVTVTTTRKFFTILLSVVLYGHALAGPQWAGVALVFAGLSLDIYAKYADRGKHGHKHAGKGQDAEKTTNHAATPIPAHSVAAAAPAAVAAPAASSGKKKKPSRKAD
jgi:UDP-galactose transporter B1